MQPRSGIRFNTSFMTAEGQSRLVNAPDSYRSDCFFSAYCNGKRTGIQVMVLSQSAPIDKKVSVPPC